MSTQSEKTKILIADDHAMVLEGLKTVIERQPDMTVVAEACNGAQALSLWKAFRPDVSILDLRMPELDGVAVIERIRHLDPVASVIMLTSFDTDYDVYRAIKAGARGYLLKDARAQTLLDCIRRVHAGEMAVPVDLSMKLAAEVCEETLTNRDSDVLRLLSAGKSNREIAQNLYISDTTVKSHLRNIFTKLNVASRVAAISSARRRGLIAMLLGAFYITCFEIADGERMQNVNACAHLLHLF